MTFLSLNSCFRKDFWSLILISNMLNINRYFLFKHKQKLSGIDRGTFQLFLKLIRLWRAEATGYPSVTTAIGEWWLFLSIAGPASVSLSLSVNIPAFGRATPPLMLLLAPCAHLHPSLLCPQCQEGHTWPGVSSGFLSHRSHSLCFSYPCTSTSVPCTDVCIQKLFFQVLQCT